MLEVYRMGKRAGYAGLKVDCCPFKNYLRRFCWEIGYYSGLKLSLIEWLFSRKGD